MKPYAVFSKRGGPKNNGGARGNGLTHLIQYPPLVMGNYCSRIKNLCVLLNNRLQLEVKDLLKHVVI